MDSVNQGSPPFLDLQAHLKFQESAVGTNHKTAAIEAQHKTKLVKVQLLLEKTLKANLPSTSPRIMNF